MPSAEVVPGAGGVVIGPYGAVLLLRHRVGDWVFPKGHIDPGESPLEAALREVEEEAGVEASCPDPTRTFVTCYRNNRGEAREIHWFLLLTGASQPTLPEATFPEGAFVPYREALERLSYPEDKRLLQDVYAAYLELRALS